MYITHTYIYPIQIYETTNAQQPKYIKFILDEIIIEIIIANID